MNPGKNIFKYVEMQYLRLSRIISDMHPEYIRFALRYYYLRCTQNISETYLGLSRICTLNEISRNISEYLWIYL